MTETRVRADYADGSGYSLARSTLALLRLGRFDRPHLDDAQVQAMAKMLQRPGCPVCRPLAEAERKYFFWFLTENYSSAETFQRLARAGGFCHAHSALLSELSEGDNQAVAAAYHRLISYFVERMTDAAKDRHKNTSSLLGISADCPACVSAETTARHQLDTLATTLKKGGVDAYREPALLCGSHLKRLLPRLPPDWMEPLLARQRQRLRTLLDADTPIDQLKSTLCAQSRAAGYPADDTEDWAEQDAVAAFIRRLDDMDECPVCVSERHAWQEWTHWLNHAAAEAGKLEGCLPLCVTHVRALCAFANPALTSQALRHAHKNTLDDIDAGLKTLRAPPPPPRNRRQAIIRRIDRLPWRRRRQFRKRAANALHRVLEPARCPLCDRLTDAGRQSLRLLFTLLREPHHRARFQRGHGLCLHHFKEALSLRPDPDVGKTMREPCLTGLELLGWELTQTERKQRWDNRPERKGRENDAWRRALRRLGGSLLTPDASVPQFDIRARDQQQQTVNR